MKDPLQLTVILSVLFVGALFWFRSQGRRREAWALLGASIGLKFAGDDDSLFNQCAGFSLFERSDTREVHNLLRGSSGRIRIALGDFRYASQSTRGTRRYFTICVLERDGMVLPHSRLRPEHWGIDALGQLLGGRDIDFADDPEFSKAYVLQGLSEQEVLHLYDARVRRWFVERKHLGLRIETFGSKMVLAVRQVEVKQARELLDHALDLMMMWAQRYEDRSAS